MLSPALCDVAEHTSAVGREARLGTASIATLLTMHGVEFGAVFEAQGDKQSRDDGGQKHEAENEDGKGGGGEHERRA